MARDLSDFNFAAFYYAEQLAALQAWKRRFWPEHTETDEHDPVVQTLSMFAFLGHSAACRLDHVARELYWPSLQLRSSAIALAALVDYRLAPASPARVDLVAQVNKGVGAGDRLLRALSTFSTDTRTSSASRATFEYDEEDDLLAEFAAGAYPYVVLGDDFAGTTELVDFSSPVVLNALAADDNGVKWIAFGHPDLEFTRIALPLAVPALAAGDVEARLEYSEDYRETEPDLVTDGGGSISFQVTTLLGNMLVDTPVPGYRNSSGALVTVRCLRTGVEATAVSAGFGAIEAIGVVGTLGQVVVSESPGDYAVRCEWIQLRATEEQEASTLWLTETAGELHWEIPEDTEHRWARSTIAITDGAAAGESRTAHWIRLRIVACTVDSPIEFSAPTQPRQTEWWLRWEALQGRRVVEVLGASDGLASQTFDLASSPFLSVVRLTAGGAEWTRADDFLLAGPFDRVYTLIEQPDGQWRVTFGDGIRGKIPTASDKIEIAYRIGGAESGNLGPGAITKDRTGNRILGLYNPRQGEGWAVQEGSTQQSLDEVRAAVPASLRTQGRAVTPEDTETLVVAYRTDEADQLAVRALAVEEGAGPKTMRVYVVGPAGVVPTATELEEIEDYLNGEQIGLQRIGGVRMANTACVVQGYAPVPFDVTVEITVLAPYASSAEGAAVAAVTALLQPTARRLLLVDGIWEESAEFQWGWGSTVAFAVLLSRIASSVSGVVNVDLTVPAGDTVLGDGELPIPGTITVTVVSVPL